MRWSVVRVGYYVINIYSLGEGAQKLEGVKVLSGSHVDVRPRGVVDLGRKMGYELFVELGIEANMDSLLI